MNDQTTEKSCPINCSDELSKHVQQTKSIVNTLAMDEHFELLDPKDVANLLWLVSDGLEKIKTFSDELSQHALSKS